MAVGDFDSFAGGAEQVCLFACTREWVFHYKLKALMTVEAFDDCRGL